MEASVIAALSAGIVSIITAIVTAIITLRTKQAIKEVKVSGDAKLQEIHTLVDGRLTKALEEIAILRSYITKTNGHTAEEVKNDAAAVSAVKPRGRK